MSAKPHKPEPSEWLRLLTGSRLQTQVLLDDLEEDLDINDRALARKTLLFEHALRFLAFATLVELAGRSVQ
jgi:hypothetical protein